MAIRFDRNRNFACAQTGATPSGRLGGPYGLERFSPPAGSRSMLSSPHGRLPTERFRSCIPNPRCALEISPAGGKERAAAPGEGERGARAAAAFTPRFACNPNALRGDGERPRSRTRRRRFLRNTRDASPDRLNPRLADERGGNCAQPFHRTSPARARAN
jgi:hypothetical protein